MEWMTVLTWGFVITMTLVVAAAACHSVLSAPEMKRDDESSDVHRLVYRKDANVSKGVPLTLLGLTSTVGMGLAFVLSWSGYIKPALRPEYCFWMIVAISVFAAGLNQSKSRRIVIDKSEQKAIVCWKLFFLQRTTTHSLANFDSVSWRMFMAHHMSDPHAYAIKLAGETKELPICSLHSRLEVDRVTSELGEFLGLKHGREML